MNVDVYDISVLKTHDDETTNFIIKIDNGKIETQYIRREQNHAIICLSSHVGCSNACRFCHLTSTGQTLYEPISKDMFMMQVHYGLRRYDETKNPAEKIHFNWMARGEALTNPYFRDYDLFEQISKLCKKRNVKAKFNVSTIMPNDLQDLRLFDEFPINIYYSLYSTQDTFRKRWLPKAKSANQAISILADWQNKTNNEVVLHWPYIDSENDSEEETHIICDTIQKYGLKTRVNILRYNPPNEKSKESSLETIYKNIKIFQNRVSPNSKIVKRVGEEISAACGMFL